MGLLVTFPSLSMLVASPPDAKEGRSPTVDVLRNPASPASGGAPGADPGPVLFSLPLSSGGQGGPASPDDVSRCLSPAVGGGQGGAPDARRFLDEKGVDCPRATKDSHTVELPPSPATSLVFVERSPGGDVLSATPTPP